MKISFQKAKFLTLFSFAFISIQAQNSRPDFNNITEVTSNDFEEVMPVYDFANDLLYISRLESDENNKKVLNIFQLEKVGTSFLESSAVLQPFHNKDNNAVVGFSNGSKKMFLLNRYSGNRSQYPGVSVSQDLGGMWTQPMSLNLKGIGGIAYYGVYMHPDEDVLIISKNDKYSMGNEDLYVSLLVDGIWQEPLHMGTVINTTGFEISPYLSDDRKSLYFSSNGHGGFGDADIYVSTRQGESWNTWSKPLNLKSLNSPFFDAYFTKGPGDDVFFVSSRNSIASSVYRAQKSGITELVEGDEQFTEEKTKISEEGVINFNSPEIQQKVIDKLNDLPTDLTVYFSLGKSDLEKQAMELLNCTAAMMTLFPELKILIRGHADQTGSLSFNQQLSYTRAQETMRYLVSRGIDANRVVLVEGFGSEKPSRLGSSEEVKSYNRRTELQFAM